MFLDSFTALSPKCFCSLGRRVVGGWVGGWWGEIKSSAGWMWSYELEEARPRLFLRANALGEHITNATCSWEPFRLADRIMKAAFRRCRLRHALSVHSSLQDAQRCRASEAPVAKEQPPLSPPTHKSSFLASGELPSSVISFRWRQPCKCCHCS